MIVFVVVKVPDAGEKIEDSVEFIFAKWLTHIVYDERKRIAAELRRGPDTIFREVGACNIVPELVHSQAMSSFSAGKIPDPCAGLKLQISTKPRDELFSFLVIPVVVQKV